MRINQHDVGAILWTAFPPQADICNLSVSPVIYGPFLLIRQEHRTVYVHWNMGAALPMALMLQMARLSYLRILSQ